MAQSSDQQQIEAIARETMQHATNYTLLLNALQAQLKTRDIFIIHADFGWGVMRKQPRQSKSFASAVDAIAYAFELYEAQHE